MRFLFVIHDLHEENNSVPLGSIYIAQALRENGVDVELYNQDVFHQSEEELEKYILNNHYDFVGMGFLAARYNRISNTFKAIRNATRATNAKMVLGAQGAAATPIYVMNQTETDFVVVGEAEQTVVELVFAIQNNKDLSAIDGLVWKDKNQEVIVNQPRKLNYNLDTISSPAYDLLPMEEYSGINVGRHDQLKKETIVGTMITSRGCLAKCSFCYRMEKGIRFRAIDKVIEEIIYLHNTYGVNYMCFQDEIISANKKRIFELCSAIKELPFKLLWVSSIRVDILTDMAVCQLLKESGCVYLSLGLESLNQRVLDLMAKDTKVGENKLAVDNCIKVGITPGLNLIWGAPGDTHETLWEQVEFIKKMNTGTECRTIRPVTPYPGSPLYYQAIREGKLEGVDDFYKKFHNSDYVTVNFTDIADDKIHEELYQANCALIDDFCEYPKVSGEGNYFSTDPDYMKKLFYDLYFNNNFAFRGIR